MKLTKNAKRVLYEILVPGIALGTFTGLIALNIKLAFLVTFIVFSLGFGWFCMDLRRGVVKS